MAKEMELQIVRCPNCKKPMTSFNPFKTVVTCSRCGTAFKNPEVTAKPAVLPERILPFTSLESDFEQSMVSTLVNQDYCDKNIFAAINTDNVFRAYLPMYLFEGQFTAAWGCESSYEDQKVDISNNWGGGKDISTKTVKKWRPQNGNSAGRFAFLCLANESADDLPQELREFTRQYPYDVMLSKQFDPTYLDAGEDNQVLTIERNADNTLVWQKHGKELVEEKARQAALDLLEGQEIRNFKAQTSYSLETKGDYLLVPFWFVYYTVNNQRYYYLMDGTGQHHAYSYPVDEEDVAFEKKCEQIKTLVGWSWLLAPIIAYLASSWATLFVLLIIWWIAKKIVNMVMNKRIAAMLEASHQKRQEGAARL